MSQWMELPFMSPSSLPPFVLSSLFLKPETNGLKQMELCTEPPPPFLPPFEADGALAFMSSLFPLSSCHSCPSLSPFLPSLSPFLSFTLLFPAPSFLSLTLLFPAPHSCPSLSSFLPLIPVPHSPLSCPSFLSLILPDFLVLWYAMWSQQWQLWWHIISSHE